MQSAIDILIVGAGPVGLSLGIECRRHGLECRLVEKKEARSTHSKALAVWPGTQEVFDAMGVGDRIREAAHPVNRMEVSLGGGKPAILDFSKDLKIPTAEPRPLLIPQSETERILEERFVELGGKVERSSLLAELTQDLEGTEALIEGPDGSRQTIHSRWVAGCDGAHSEVRSFLEIEFEGRAIPSTFLLADVTIEGELDREAGHFFASNGKIAGFLPFGNSSWRVITRRAPGDENTASPNLEEIVEGIRDVGPKDLALSNPTWLSAFHVKEHRAERFHLGRSFLAGDAAHIHSPAGGQGMNTGIQDAYNLGWKIALICNGASDWRSLLDSYEEERIPIADHVLERSGEATEALLVTNPIKRFLRNTAAAAAFRSKRFRADLAAELSELDLDYEESSMFDRFAHWHEDFRHVGFACGERIRDGIVYEGGDEHPQSILEKTQTTIHTLLVFEGVRPHRNKIQNLKEVMASLPHDVPKERLAIYGIARSPEPPDIDPRIHWLHDPDGSTHQRFAAFYACWYLVRPDQVVTIRSMPAEGEPLADYCTRFLL